MPSRAYPPGPDEPFKIGMRVRVIVPEKHYSEVGDKAILTSCDEDHDWFGRLEKDGFTVCLTQNGHANIIPANEWIGD